MYLIEQFDNIHQRMQTFFSKTINFLLKGDLQKVANAANTICKFAKINKTKQRGYMFIVADFRIFCGDSGPFENLAVKIITKPWGNLYFFLNF